VSPLPPSPPLHPLPLHSHGLECLGCDRALENSTRIVVPQDIQNRAGSAESRLTFVVGLVVSLEDTDHPNTAPHLPAQSSHFVFDSACCVGSLFSLSLGAGSGFMDSRKKMFRERQKKAGVQKPPQACVAARCSRSLHTSKLTSEARAGPTRNAACLAGSRLASKQEAGGREAGAGGYILTSPSGILAPPPNLDMTISGTHKNDQTKSFVTPDSQPLTAWRTVLADASGKGMPS